MFELANPWVLLGLLLPFVLWFFIPKAPLQLPAALTVPFFDALRALSLENEHSLKGKTSIFLPFCIWSLIIIALAGPRWVGEPQSLHREGYNIMMALDLSGSMEMNDMLLHGRAASRLDVVKNAAQEFVKERSADKIGLILFGTRAYLQTPMTYDHHSILMRIEDASAGLAGKTTSIGDALGLAVKHLQNIDAKDRVIILLTDGANNSGILSPLNAAALAKADGIKIYTIGLGSSVDPRFFNDRFSPYASMDLDENTLQQTADLTGGRYFRATDPNSLQKIYQTINQLESSQQEAAVLHPQKEYYPWPLTFAILLFFYWFLQKSGLFLLPQRIKPDWKRAHYGR